MRNFLSPQEQMILKEAHRAAQEKRHADKIDQNFGVKYTPEGLTHLLHRLGFVYKKTKPVPGKADPDKQRAFLETYHELKDEKGPHDRIYFMDGAHPNHNAMPAYGWIQKGVIKEIPTNTARKRINLNGALIFRISIL